MIPPKWFSVPLVVLGLVACGDGPVGPITQLPRQLTVAETQLVQANNRFAFKLFREINAQDSTGGNIFISPLSVAMALGMAYNGAAGDTRDSMGATLELTGMTPQEVNEAYRGLIDLLSGLDAAVDWHLANSIWYADVTLLPAFVDQSRTYFDAEMRTIDLTDPVAASAQINQWVNDQTRGLIQEIVPSPMAPNALVHILNAVYFKANWSHQFDKSLTAPEPFALTDGSSQTVDMMKHEEKVPLRFASTLDLQVVELPYARGAYSMVLLLPRDPPGAPELARSVSASQWDDWVAALDSTNGFVELPRFTIEFGTRLDKVLTHLGMGIAFEPGLADFTNMFADGSVPINAVRHKAFVRVGEEGTEAAAVTDVEDVSAGPLEIVVDHPFLFVIRERLSGAILFMGRVMNPAERS